MGAAKLPSKRRAFTKDKSSKKQKVESGSGSGSEPEPEPETQASEDESSDNEGDELDESDDELDKDEGEEMDEEDGEQGEGKDNGRTEQKRLLKERKMARPMGTKIQQIKQLWEKLRVKKDTPGEIRTKLVNEIWTLMQDCIKELVFKHDSSRVVQTVFKYSDKEKRQAITEALSGSYVDLAKSPYGKFLLVKIMHYGSNKTRAQVINELYGNFSKLMKHKEGAYLVEDIYRDYSTAAQKRMIMREFYGPGYALFKDEHESKPLSQMLQEYPEKRQFIMKNLYQILKSAVGKGSIGFQLIHAVMLEYVSSIDNDQDRENFVDLVSEQFPEIVHTNEGSQVACRILAIATAKERKALVRSLKSFATNCAKDEYGFIVLISLFSTVDDTVLVAKTFNADLKANMTDLIKNKMGRRPLMYLLLGRSPRYFPKHVQDQLQVVDQLKAKTSKKDDKARRLELNRAFSPLMMEAIEQNAEELMNETLGSQFIAEALLYAHETDRSKAMAAVLQTFQKEDLADTPLSQPFTGRALKTLVQGGTWNNKLRQLELSPEPSLEFAAQLTPIILPHIADWASGDGSFVVVSLLENSDQKKDIAKALKPYKKKLPVDTNKGSKLIVELME